MYVLPHGNHAKTASIHLEGPVCSSRHLKTDSKRRHYRKHSSLVDSTCRRDYDTYTPTRSLHLVLGVELDLEELGAVNLAPCALADDLGGEHEVLYNEGGNSSTRELKIKLSYATIDPDVTNSSEARSGRDSMKGKQPFEVLSASTLGQASGVQIRTCQAFKCQCALNQCH